MERRQVAAYCRVSTDKEDQRNSFENQKAFFERYIAQQPGWQLCAVYADEGVTGTSTRKRRAFQAMLADARAGRFSRILTKEISRFSRNILDTIRYTRELKALGVGVYFLNDGIDTLEPDAELRLSILASIAQEESRRTSQRVKWGQTRQMEKGVVFGRAPLGYRLEQGRLTPEPEGAALVRRIFTLYGAEGMSAEGIAALLQREGRPTCRGAAAWSGSVIRKILKNEKYVGDLVQKKSFTPDYLTHRKQINRGEEPQIVLQNHHAPVVDRPLWEQVQRRLSEQGGRPGASRLLSGRIRCGCCGGPFVARQKSGKDGVRRYWRCSRACRPERTGEGERRCPIGRGLSDAAAEEALRRCLDTVPADLWELAAAETGKWISRCMGSAAHAGEEALSALLASIRREGRYPAALLEEVLEGITVFPDGTLSVSLRGFPWTWRFRWGEGEGGVTPRHSTDIG